MKYSDGKYHIEYLSQKLWDGFFKHMWCVVNVHGEQCTYGNLTAHFNTEDAAQEYCDKLNVCPEGGVITNLT